MSKFRLLLWRNYRLRRHHWIFTLAETCLPILLMAFVIMYNGVSEVFPAGKEPFSYYNSSTTEESLISEMPEYHLLNRIYHAPSNNFTDTLMNSFTDTLMNHFRRPVRKHYRYYDEISIIKLENESRLYEEMRMDSENHKNFIGILFLNTSSAEDTIPDTLNYELKLCDDLGYVFRTFFRHHKTLDWMYNTYQSLKFSAGIQIILNKAFISLKTNSSVPEQVLFEEFPHEFGSQMFPRVEFAQYAPYLILIVSMISSVRLILDITREKKHGSTKLMRVAGVKEWMIWVSWFLDLFVVMLMVLTFTILLLKFPFKCQMSLFPYTEYCILGTIILLYGAANAIFCLSLSAIFNSTLIAFLALCVSVIIPYGMLMKYSIHNYPALMYYSLIFPVGALMQGFERITFFEIFGRMDKWSGFFSTEVGLGAPGVSLLLVIIMLCAQVIFFLCVFVFVTTRKTRAFNFNKVRRFSFQEYEFAESIFEPALEGKEMCLGIENLYTSDSAGTSLKGISMNIYKAEINTLLGNEMSGGSSFISVLAGLSGSNSGLVFYKGENMLSNINKFKRNVGLCLKENWFFPYLSVKDNLLFYAKLKGFSKSEVETEVDHYLSVIELENYILYNQLSEVIKRRLCLVAAFIGKPEIVIIDDLCAGVDKKFRPELRNLLLNLHEKQTIILNTTDVSEAEAVSSYTTVLRDGFIVAHGTMEFLNETFDAGCCVTLTKMNNPADTDLTSLNAFFEQNIRGTIKYQTEDEIAYILPSTETYNYQYPKFFENLEQNLNSLGIKSWTVSYETFEQKLLGKYIIKPKLKKETPFDNITPTYKTKTGFNLTLQQIMATYKKKFLYTIRNFWFLFYQVVVLTSISLLLLATMDLGYGNFENKTISSSLDIFYHPRVLLQYPENRSHVQFYETNLEYLRSHEAEIVFSNEANLHKDPIWLDWSRGYTSVYNLLFAIGYDVRNHLILYNPRRVESLSTAINAYSNTLLQYLTRNNQYKIQTTVHPMNLWYYEQRSLHPSLYLPFYLWWYIALAFLTMDLMWCIIDFVNKDRRSYFGGPPANCDVPRSLHWFLNFTFDFTLLMLIVLSRLLVITAFGDQFHFFDVYQVLGILTTTTLFCISGIFFMYVVGQFIPFRKKWYIIFVAVNVIGGLLGGILDISILSNSYYGRVYSNPVEWVFSNFVEIVILLLPFTTYGATIFILLELWLRDMPRSFDGLIEFSKSIFRPQFGVSLNFLFLCVDCLLWLVILIILEKGYFTKFANYVKWCWFSHWTVIDSENEIENGVRKDEKKKDAAFVMELRQIRINWGGILSYKCQLDFQGNPDGRVAGLYIFRNKQKYSTIEVNFAVSPGECLVLVGKCKNERKSIFKILSGLESCPEAKVLLDGLELNSNRKQYLANIAYCSENVDVLEELTGREILTFAASVKGLRTKKINEIIHQWIVHLGLEEQQNERCSTYNKGDKKRLCFALALMNNPKVILLEEPLKGVDSISREIILNQLEMCKRRGQMVLISSDSLNDVAEICDRVAVIDGGKIKFLGSIQQLRETYKTTGFSITIRTVRQTLLNRRSFRNLKHKISNSFYPVSCVLQKEDEDHLHYYINDDNLAMSILFMRLEEIKLKWNMVKDYSVTNTSLDILNCFNE